MASTLSRADALYTLSGIHTASDRFERERVLLLIQAPLPVSAI